MEFSYDLPKSKLERDLEQLDHFYEGMQSHPGEWVKLTGATCFSPGNYYYSVGHMLRCYPKRYPHITVRTVDSVQYASYVVPIKRRRQPFRRLWTATTDHVELWLPILFTLGLAAIFVIALIVYK